MTPVIGIQSDGMVGAGSDLTLSPASIPGSQRGEIWSRVTSNVKTCGVCVPRSSLSVSRLRGYGRNKRCIVIIIFEQVSLMDSFPAAYSKHCIYSMRHHDPYSSMCSYFPVFSLSLSFCPSCLSFVSYYQAPPLLVLYVSSLLFI